MGSCSQGIEQAASNRESFGLDRQIAGHTFSEKRWIDADAVLVEILIEIQRQVFDRTERHVFARFFLRKLAEIGSVDGDRLMALYQTARSLIGHHQLLRYVAGDQGFATMVTINNKLQDKIGLQL